MSVFASNDRTRDAGVAIEVERVLGTWHGRYRLSPRQAGEEEKVG
jgi:hypothetical protein